MYFQAFWIDKNKTKIAQLLEAESWEDAANQCTRSYKSYTLRYITLVEFALDPYNINGNAYNCTIVLPEGRGQKTLLIMADSFRQAQEQLVKFEPEKIISIQLTQYTYKQRA